MNDSWPTTTLTISLRTCVRAAQAGRSHRARRAAMIDGPRPHDQAMEGQRSWPTWSVR